MEFYLFLNVKKWHIKKKMTNWLFPVADLRLLTNPITSDIYPYIFPNKIWVYAGLA